MSGLNVLANSSLSEQQAFVWGKTVRPVVDGVDNIPVFVHLTMQIPKAPSLFVMVYEEGNGNPFTGSFVRKKSVCVRGVLEKIFGSTVISKSSNAKDVVSVRMEKFAFLLQRRTWFVYIWKLAMSGRVSAIYF
jgi:hypothetical protein